MTETQRIYVGGAVHQDGTTETFVAPTRSKLVHHMNEWLVEHAWTDEVATILPALDGWSRSTHDDTLWSVKIPDAGWSLWMRSEVSQLH
jgi:hypothetical protein